MSYLALKHLHLTCAVLTALSFITRGLLLASRPQALNARFWRVAPHVNDTVLLAAGVGMAVIGGFNPLTTPWLATKLVLLLAYIGLGTLALKRSKTPQQRAIAFVLALAALAAIVQAALSKQGWWG
jgi:uncharacterized membrane protein SirB2